MTEQLDSVNDGAIAIVGMSCRFPGAPNVEEFWRNLAGGIESITRLSDEEILQSGVSRADLTDPNYVKAAPVLEEPGGFDAGFFGFSPMEARTMDPQHRILLELASEALEDAGCDSGGYPGRIGVFTGAAMNTYFMNSGLNRRFAKDYIPTLIVNDKDFLSTRISYKLNLKGPSITIQTACSTSLVAIHLARQSLLSEETDMALAGAISVRVPHRAGYFFDGGGVVSPDGRVRAFDARANGTVFGSGGGIIVLKRLTDAIADGDIIHAVIKGSAVNNDGSEKAGYTAPSVNSQADVVVEALANAGIDADSISYVEAHGSGTPLGDPIEIMALTKAFRRFTNRSGYCAIGSVKTNIGHLDAAAGIAGLIKTVLALKHRELPASLHYSEPNPELDFSTTPFYVNTRLAPWISNSPRRAGIMSTGMGGTNAHVVLEEAPTREETVSSGLPHLLILSARTETALDAAAVLLVESLKRNVTTSMDDIAFTLQTGRRTFSHRRFLICADRNDAISRLEDNQKRIAFSRVDESTRRPLILLLPGIGDLYVGAAHGLHEHFAVFRNEVGRCAQILEPYLGVDIRQILYPKSVDWQKHDHGRKIDLQRMLAGNFGPDSADSRRLNQTVYAQPALFTVEYALARLWSDLGVIPDAIVGHSMGEYVAACLAGVLSLEDALRLIVRRTQLVARLPEGRMLAVTLPEKDILPLLNEDLSISLINGPNLCVVAGPNPAVDDFERVLGGKGVICRPVRNTHAFHSRMLDPIVKEFEEEVRKVQLNEPRIPCMSNVTGTWISKEEAANPAYWARHTNHTARFDEALRNLWQFRDAILLEAGPGRTLGVLAMQHPDQKNAGNSTAIASVRHHYENQQDVEILMLGVGKLWLSGVKVNWENLHQGKPRRKTSLPTYPFDRRRYWLEQNDSQTAQELPPNGEELERSRIADWFYVPSWKRTPFPADLANLNGESPENGISWLVFTDRWGQGAGFRKKLEEFGSAVHVVQFGERFARREDGSFEINPARLEDYLNLFRGIKDAMGHSLHIVHLGCLTADDDRGPVNRDHNQNFGFFSLLYIAQAIGELNISAPIKIGIISNRMHEITGEETLNPEMIPALGLSGVIPREFPNVSCFNVDLPGPRPVDGVSGDIITRIVTEFAEPNQSDVIGYRGKHRWKRTYERVILPNPGASGGEELPGMKRLRDRGVYLITGGTGGLGLAFAKYLAKARQARIVLTKKTAFPDRSKWNELLATEDALAPAIKTIKTIKAILEIEKLGAECEVFVSDVSDREQMRRVLDETLKRFGAISGVIHAAGVVRPGLIQTKTKEAADAVLSPKVQGTVILFDLLKETNLDFLVLVSSIASVTAPYAHSDYTAANCFLDAFASYSNSQRKFHTLTINWPVWKEVGIVAELQTVMGVEDWKEEALENAILTREGLEVFERALNSDLPQVIVSPENLQLLLKEPMEMPAPRRSLNGDGGELLADSLGNEIEPVVARIWSGILGLEQIGIHDEFLNLGGHSLMAMQIVAKVRATYPIDFTLRNFFEASTIARLSSLIREKIISRIETLSDTEAGPLTSSNED